MKKINQQLFNTKDLFFLGCFVAFLFFFRNAMLTWGMGEIRGWEGFVQESLKSLNFSYDILDGNWRGWKVYLYSTRGHLGNELIISFFAFPLYLFLDPSMLVAYQAPIIFSSILLGVLYWFCIRCFSRRVAIISCLLMLCAPASLQQFALAPVGVVFEVSTWSLLAALLFFKGVGSTSRIKYLLFGLLGGVIGFGTFHNIIMLCTVLSLCFVWFFYYRREVSWAPLMALIGGFLIGGAPIFFLDSGKLVGFIPELLSGRYSDPSISLFGLFDRQVIGVNEGFSVTYKVLFERFNQVTIFFINLLFLIGFTFYRYRYLRVTPGYFFLVVFTGFYSLALLIYNAPHMPHYNHALFIPLFILFADLFDCILKKNKSNLLRFAIYLFIGWICVTNLYEIYSKYEVNTMPAESRAEKLKENQKRLKMIRGCSFFQGWSEPFPIENWTNASKEVWAAALKENNSIIKNPNTYLVYAANVSFLGLEQMVKNIEQNVPSNKKQEAYKGMAVYYTNDFWFRQIIKNYREGLIDSLIPEQYRSFFYGELSRRLLDRFGRDIAKIRKETKGLDWNQLEKAFELNYPELNF